MLYLKTLGGLTLEEDGVALLPGRRKPLALLLWLALREGRPATREQLATLLWGDSGEANARRSLRQCLSELRGAVGDRLVESDAGISVASGAFTVDALLLRERVSAGQFEEVLALAGADFLPGGDALGPEPWQEWVAAERSALEEPSTRAFLGAYGAMEERAEWHEALAIAEQWRRIRPDDGRSWTREVVALQALGRIADASERIAMAKAHFVDILDTRLPDELTKLARVIERLGEHQGTSRSAVLTPELVGRAHALARLSAARQQTRPGTASTGRRVLLVAAEGLGRTRLLREFARQARPADAAPRVVHVTAHPDDRARPWALASQLVAQLAAVPALAGLHPDTLAALATIAPEIRQEYRHLPDVTADAAKVATAIVQSVAEVAHASGLVLLIDDVPQADELSLGLCSALAQRPPARCVVVAAGRPDEWDAHASLREMLVRVDPADRVSLEPLTPDECTRVIASMVPLEAADVKRLTEVIAPLAAGRPGLVTSLVTQAATIGALHRDAAGRWALTPTLPPESLIGADLRDRWRTHYERADAGRATIDALAVLCGHGAASAERSDVEAVSGLTPDVFSRTNDALQLAGVLSVAGRHIALATGVWRHLAMETLSGATTRLMHRRAATALAGDPARREEAKRHQRAAGVNQRPRLFYAAAALLAVVVAGSLVLRPARASTSVGTPLLLADIENLTGDTSFDRTLTLAASIGLQQSRQVTLFPRTRVRETLALMQRSGADSVLDEGLAREVAIRENLPRVAALSISRLDSTFLLTARLVDPNSGSDLFADREPAASRTDVLASLDRLLTRVRRATGEPEDSLRAYAVPLPRVTTASLPALRALVAGREAFTRREYSLAAEMFRRAVSLDSNFAMAWLSLSDSYYSTSTDPVRGRAALDRALALRDRLTEREQIRLDQSAAFRDGRRIDGLRLAELLARRFPERDSWYSLGTVLMQARRCPDAMVALRRATRFDARFANSYINIATCHLLLGHPDSALTAYAEAHVADSTVLYSGSLNHEFGFALIRVGLLDSATRVFARMARSRNPQHRGFGFRSLGYAAGQQGRYAEASALFDSAASASQEAGATVSVLRSRVLQAEHLLAMGDTAGGRRALDAAWISSGRVNLAPSFALYTGVAFLRAGQVARAQAMLAAIDKVVATATDSTERAILAARVSMARRDYGAARTNLTLATDTTRAAFSLAALAELFESLGQVDSALATYKRLASYDGRGWEAQDIRFRSLAIAGNLMAAHRGPDVARFFDDILLGEWKTPDSLHPYVLEARQRARMRANTDAPPTRAVRP